MEYSPPPLFKQGTSARVKVVLFTLVSLILLVADSRLRSLTAIREAVGTALYPLQVAAALPRDGILLASNYFTTVSTLQKENRDLRQQQIANAQTLQQSQYLAAENTRLRSLLSATERIENKVVMSEVRYVARDPFSRKIVLDRGSRQGVAPGQPVIDDAGVVGQVTRVFPLTSEVTLLTDREQAIPVQVLRTGLRSVAYGQGQSGLLELRFLPNNVDIQSGDMIVTSGIDGVYPPGLAVAKVTQVETKASDAFARIYCQPLAGIDRHRHLLVLLTPPLAAEPSTLDTPTPRKTPSTRTKQNAEPPPRASGASPESAPATTAPTAAAAPAAPAAPAGTAAAATPPGAPAPAANPVAHLATNQAAAQAAKPASTHSTAQSTAQATTQAAQSAQTAKPTTPAAAPARTAPSAPAARPAATPAPTPAATPPATALPIIPIPSKP